ncbi:hypothetical protein Hamer_G027220 [Homarus americanus]|uniref:Uncharacterized protein n=1 Tax=Homarus americanus TaxID=6706 RepID=A0A8J5K807_HOMAM|nr:hypothetical protein Hamer_G027220 [Homarus americanus]
MRIDPVTLGPHFPVTLQWILL